MFTFYFAQLIKVLICTQHFQKGECKRTAVAKSHSVDRVNARSISKVWTKKRTFRTQSGIFRQFLSILMVELSCHLSHGFSAIEYINAQKLCKLKTFFWLSFAPPANRKFRQIYWLDLSSWPVRGIRSTLRTIWHMQWLHHSIECAPCATNVYRQTTEPSASQFVSFFEVGQLVQQFGWKPKRNEMKWKKGKEKKTVFTMCHKVNSCEFRCLLAFGLR